MKKNILIAITLMIAGAASALLYLNPDRSDESTITDPQSAFCARHQIAEKDCPWCDLSLVDKLGICPGHGVPEALCSRCNTALIPGFKAEGDWCVGHTVPESQCAVCRGAESASGEAPCPGKET
jgi:hypothetical protein